MFPACRDRQELLSQAEARLGEIAGRRRRIFLWEEEPPPQFTANPVGAALRDRECAVVDGETWARYCPRADHGHVLVGPVLVRSRLAGAVCVTRGACEPPFGAAELDLMNRLCLHLSSRLAELPTPPEGLTPRETEVTRAVCRGLRNAEVARELSLSEHTVKQNLKSIFRKLGVRSRTELVRRLCV